MSSDRVVVGGVMKAGVRITMRGDQVLLAEASATRNGLRLVEVTNAGDRAADVRSFQVEKADE